MSACDPALLQTTLPGVKVSDVSRTVFLYMSAAAAVDRTRVYTSSQRSPDGRGPEGVLYALEASWRR
jgi:hypothetical protein